MSREIKYRVKVTWCDEVWIAKVTDIGFGKWVEGAVIGEGFFDLSSYSVEYVDFDTSTGDVLMQYTGLKDKNGIEIYEGDIVKRISMAIGGRDTVGIVKELDGCWVIDSGNDAIKLWTESDQNEVIGNIHENPELMEIK